MLADIVDHVIGIDPDRDRITASLVEASTGGEVATAAFETTRGGYERLVACADRPTSPESRAWAVEGSGSYGSRACAHPIAAGEQVIEFSHPRHRGDQRRRQDRHPPRPPGSAGGPRTPRPRRPTRPGPPRGAASAGDHPPRRPDGAHRGDQRTQSPHHQRARRPVRPTPRPHHRRPSRQMRRVPTAGGPTRRAHSHQTGPAQPRAADQDPHHRGRRPPNQHPRTRRSRRPPPARPARRRTHHRRATLHRLVTPRPLPQRSSLRPPRRRRPTRSVPRTEHPPPPQPPRRPPTQPRAAHHRRHPQPLLPPHPGPHRQTNRPRQNPPRSPTLPQTLHRPPDLPPPPTPQNQHLTNIEASFPRRLKNGASLMRARYSRMWPTGREYS